MSLRQVVKDYLACADPKAAVDYAFHLIISDPTEQVTGAYQNSTWVVAVAKGGAEDGHPMIAGSGEP